MTSDTLNARGGHTTGPWGVGDGFEVYSISEYCSVATVLGDARAEANAHLIAAAPEMFEALSGLLDRYLSLANSGDAGFWNPEKEDEVIAARAALAKAVSHD